MKKLKTFFKSIAVAFSIYSKVPMPPFKWESDDMKYHLIFFPFVGFVLGLIEALWLYTAECFEVNRIAATMVALGIVIIYTGGFHLDGFLDTMDAFHSYGDKEKKLEILKDPHIGAFSVIMTIAYFLFYIAFLSEVKDYKILLIWCLSFAASRATTGIVILRMKNAKAEGMLNSETENSGKSVIPWLIAQLAVLTLAAFFVSVRAAVIITIAQVDLLIYFKSVVNKEFGGISGDTAGFYNCIFEFTTAAVLCIIGWIGVI